MRAREVGWLGAWMLLCGCQGNVGVDGLESEYGARRGPPRATEECGNGYDDDGDGDVDEGCPCTLGQTQACFTADSTLRRKGICADGIQQCLEDFEFTRWGDCVGEIRPIGEVVGNGADDDCDGQVDEGGDFPGAGGEGVCTPAELEVCDNGADDDCDGLTDCDDPQCGGSCTGGDYPGTTGEPPACQEGWVCVPGQYRWCDTPTYCSWGQQFCGPDGQWGECIEKTARPGLCTGRWYDPECCQNALGCCQNYPYDNSSVGSCGGISCE